jgi:hypothetical protein
MTLRERDKFVTVARGMRQSDFISPSRVGGFFAVA